ncbi:MAG TPA: hypothetical protein VHX42_04135, partial [Candidatus Babeliales bacterium]|nr:hypothetical protein [Candidatus Babeliales bacterium]
NQISKDLNDFLYNSHNNIGLAFYNINVDDIEPIEEMHPNDAKERKSKIYSLLYHLIPTIFIFSGDKNTSQDITDSLTTYISQSAEKVAVLSPSYRFNQEWEHHKEKWMTSTEEVMSFLEKKRSTIPMSPYSAEASSFAKASEDRPEGKSPTQSPSFAPSSAESSGGHGKAPEGRPNNSPRKTATSSQSSSSSCNDLEILEYKRKILKKRLELYVSSSSSSKSEDSYDVAETSSSHSKEIEYISNGQ